ncbi:serine/threonine-protein kinase [Mariniblastus sp.]|nr:serine/threonine-protein kinase [Mariniblastus sp.]
MSDDSPESLGDDPTYVGKGKEREDQSLGDQSTYAGSNESSLGDLGSIGDDLGDSLAGLEIVDLESRYTIIRPIGKGGMGEVFLATDTRLNRKVAIKRIKDELTTPAAAARFLTEAKSIAALSHPYIVQVYDYGRAKDGPFLIMEYVEGENLQQVCNQGVMALEDAVDLSCKLCDALGTAHSQGIIHRDIKPANILMTSGGWPKITDFGLAKSTNDHGHTMTGTALGTLDFMPPEQRRDASAVDHRSDLWSLAATIYQMVTGESPRVIDLEDVPGALRSVLAKALKTKPESRYQSAVELGTALVEGMAATEQPVVVSAAELGAGECPKCNTKNDSSRKFCSGCGESLRFACLECEQQIPVWENFCGECGIDQRKASRQLQRELISQIQKARIYSEKSQYKSALDLAEGVLINAQGRFASAEKWAKEFIEVNNRYFESQTKDAASSLLIAKKHREKFEYRESLEILRTINSEVRTPEINSFELAVKEDWEELKELLGEINRRIKSRELDSLNGLILMIERAYELGGEERSKQKGLLSLKKSLEKRRKRAFDRDRMRGVKIDQDSDAKLLDFLTKPPQKLGRRVSLHEYAAQKVEAPANGLIIANLLGPVMAFFATTLQPQAGDWIEIASSALIMCACPLICILGLMKMKQLQFYWVAYASCLISMVPCGGCCFVGFPLGVWALSVLNEERVKRAFR